MGSARTGRVLAEALGLPLPGLALTPAPLTKLLRYARATGKQVVRLIEGGLTPRRLLTRRAFEDVTGREPFSPVNAAALARAPGV
jgi:dihydroxy-acid dehydratase